MKYQPYYLAYAKFSKLSPDDVMARDEKKYPGGCMTNYILWIDEKWNDFCAEFKINRHYALAHASKFQKWLEAKVP